MSDYTNGAGRRLWMPEPAVEPSDEPESNYCPICGAKLDLFDPFPLCGICERDTREEY